ncbi:MAG: hypothetical protein IJM63_06245 [Solobacterium sp.]|nr:hypothetical protein [Solobacterium sp.]
MHIKKSVISLIIGNILLLLFLISAFVFQRLTLADYLIGAAAIVDLYGYIYYKKQGE